MRFIAQVCVLLMASYGGMICQWQNDCDGDREWKMNNNQSLIALDRKPLPRTKRCCSVQRHSLSICLYLRIMNWWHIYWAHVWVVAIGLSALHCSLLSQSFYIKDIHMKPISTENELFITYSVCYFIHWRHRDTLLDSVPAQCTPEISLTCKPIK